MFQQHVSYMQYVRWIHYNSKSNVSNSTHLSLVLVLVLVLVGAGGSGTRNLLVLVRTRRRPDLREWGRQRLGVNREI
jgi:hypothetical protein